MVAPSVLVIGASGFLGRPILQELLHQQSLFRRIAILADESKVHKFADDKANGVEIVVGSFTDPASFHGTSLIIQSMLIYRFQVHSKD